MTPDHMKEYLWHMAWRVPVDDSSHRDYDVAIVPVFGDAARDYLERRKARPVTIPTVEFGNAVLAGEMRLEDTREHTNVILVQDYVSQVAGGPIPDREQFHLGRADAGPILIRKVLERELRALANGQLLTEWAQAVGTTGEGDE